MAIGAGTGMIVSGAISAIGNLFSNPARQQYKYQKKLMEAQWKREDLKRPFRSALMENPYMQSRIAGLQRGMGPINFGALQQAGMVSPRMAALFNAGAPRWNPLPGYQGPPQAAPGMTIDQTAMARNRLAQMGYTPQSMPPLGIATNTPFGPGYAEALNRVMPGRPV